MTRGQNPHRVESRDDGSLDGLYRRYAKWLRHMLRTRFGAVDRSAAEDLVQETYIRIAPYQARGEVRHPQALLLHVASNLARNHTRQMYRHRLAPVAIEEMDERDEYGVLAEQGQDLLLAQLVNSLPEVERDVFVLSRYTRLTNQAIAAELGISVATVEARMTRALLHMTKRLAEGA